MQSIAEQAIYSAITGEKVFCKFLSANDTGETGGHAGRFRNVGEDLIYGDRKTPE